MTHRRSFAPPCLLLAAAFSVPITGLAWDPEDRLAVAEVPFAVPSPDGRRLAYVVRRAHADEGWRSSLHIAGADGSGARRYTRGDGSVSDPRWSPDGKRVGYLHRRPGERPQLMAVAVGGGAPRQLTDLASGVLDFRWSPDGDSVALLRPEAGRESFDPAARHLWLLPLADEAAPPARPPARPRRLTGGDYSVGHPLLDGTLDFSPDGRSIAFTRTSGAEPGAWPSADIAIVEVAGGTVRPFQQSNAAEFAPRFSPNGRRIAFTVTVYPPSWIRQSRIAAARHDGSGLKLLATTPDEQPRLVGWLSSRTVLIEEPHRTATGLWTLPADGGAPRRFDDGAAVLRAVTLSTSNTRLAMVRSSTEAAPEVAVTALRHFRPKSVSTANAAAPTLPAGTTRTVRWSGADGSEIEGLLTVPARQRPAERLPLVLLVPDGPGGVFTNDYLGTTVGVIDVAALTGAGYATLRANVRGASGYGYGFRAALRGDWGGVDYDDLMRGLDHAVELGVADPQRLAVAGWGYGGYLAAWTVCRSHRFAAAIAGAPIADLATFSTTTDVPGLIHDHLGGRLWQRRELYMNRSPLLCADDVTTPTLILHGEADARVPAAQGLALHGALRQHGVDTRLHLYPGSGHEPTAPRQIVDAGRQVLAWLERYLQ